MSGKILNKAKDITKAKIPKPTPQQALEGLKMFYESYQENHKVTETEKTKREEIRAIKEVEIEKIKANKEIIKEYFEKTFKERRENFEKFFDVLDKGLESNNIDIIQSSLGAIVDLAKNTPLKEIQKLQNDFHNPDVKELEF